MVKLDSTRLFHTLTTKADEYHLKQRNKIETLFSLLKGTYNLVTTRTRSVAGYLAGIYASLCAYQICHQNKPMIRIMEISVKQDSGYLYSVYSYTVEV